ncbi:ATP-binding protein [Methanogenium marinum]|uniref:ATP-binding protein n=1 Tax=Methanogenium marinum TaxID=348610 RepID=A0A9Q4KMI0_9EURY|nr:ATP-binding protein [Methanogenium marinum]MDE4907188.1 ATP-binding protein [Methanogenium marinum]
MQRENSSAIGKSGKKARHITTLHIENFRAIGELEYHPHQINIITGQNNTGKSALLDAVFINATGGEEIHSFNSPSEIYNIHIQANQAVLTSDITEVTIYRSLEDCRKADPEIYGKIRNDIIEHISDVFIHGEEYGDDLDQYLTTIFAYTDFCITVSDFSFHVFPYYPKGKDILRKELDAIGGMQVRQTPAAKKGKTINFRDVKIFQLFPGRWATYRDPSFVEETLSVNKLSHSDKFQIDTIGDTEIHLLEQFIKEHDLVKNMERLTQKNVLYRKNGEIEEIPISAHGDGFIVLLTILHSLLQSENGILIIEEPENHLHPRYLGVLIETLFTYCRQLNVQVFMATHSYDLIQGALEFPETEAEKEMLLISKMTSDGETIEKFDYTTDAGLKVINELYLDLRGI